MQVTTSALEISLARFLAASRTTGGAIAWSRSGEPVRLVVAGTDGRDPTTPITRRSCFLVASVTKIFTGVLALRLIDEHRFALDEAIGGLVPDWPELRDVTPRQLLSHTSGIAPQGDDDGNGTAPYRLDQRELLRENETRIFTLEETLAWVQGRPLLSLPGAVVRYSNTNFLLLAHLAEQVTGQRFADLLQQRVLDPLGLVDTWYLSDEPNVGTFVPGYMERDGVLGRVDDRLMASVASHIGPAGALVSSAADLVSFGVRVLRNHELVSEDLATQAFTIGPGGTGLGVLGITQAEPGKHPFTIFGGSPEAKLIGIGGGGMLPGTSTKLVYLTEADTVVALLLNRSSPPGGTEFFRQLVDLFAIAD